MTSITRPAQRGRPGQEAGSSGYPRFKRTITSRGLHDSFTPEQAEPRDRILTKPHPDVGTRNQRS
ncbi:conserved hypothetical protein [Streptomyces pristinaespiralis ATCC 25486]|uniref:Uncharacterized protein n=1 Tax=Streptomyces pristinaespiralis (strain ATCC 25486 / DSM 40338 / CBS 914.69 / JCM 4507 / KCC S-0507 / NBRC 13074 / NRRL 2958 / 5647) TaxID=457429 RepID=B5HCY7_STRE2|nr:conserved hypothetical protein [Streptomyces pristinaespiralis ATCC 25486]